MAVDSLDRRILALLDAEPRTSVLALSRELGIARGTAQARLDRLQRDGVIRTLAPSIDPAALGFPVMAFVTAEIRQGNRDEGVIEHLRSIPEVLEVYSITGPGDLLIRIVAGSNADLQRVVDGMVSDPNVLRSSTVVVLETQVAYRTRPLVERGADG